MRIHLVKFFVIWVVAGASLWAAGSDKKPTWISPPASKNNPQAVMCATDVKICEDGSAVGRDPNKNCAFKACPVKAMPSCSEASEECPIPESKSSK